MSDISAEEYNNLMKKASNKELASYADHIFEICFKSQYKHALEEMSDRGIEPCKRCEGKGYKVIGHRDFGAPGTNGPITDKCYTCSGKGYVDIPTLDWNL